MLVLRTFPVFAVLFFVVPLIEIYLLIQVGSWVGVLPTILLVVLTAVLGAFLLRQQGLSTLARFQQSLGKGRLPASELLEGVILLVGGALLMTPGFFTDTLGFLCLLPFTRPALIKLLLNKTAVKVQGVGTTSSQSEDFHVHKQQSNVHSSRDRQGQTTIEGEYVRKDE